MNLKQMKIRELKKLARTCSDSKQNAATDRDDAKEAQRLSTLQDRIYVELQRRQDNIEVQLDELGSQINELEDQEDVLSSVEELLFN